MALATRCLVATLTAFVSFTTWETVAIDTPAAFATSLMVAMASRGKRFSEVAR